MKIEDSSYHLLDSVDTEMENGDAYWSYHTLSMASLSFLELANFSCLATNELGTASVNLQILGQWTF